MTRLIPETIAPPFIKSLLDPHSKDYFYFSEDQFLIKTKSLTEKGQKVVEEIIKGFRSKGKFTQASLLVERSGRWYPDQKSPFLTQENNVICLNSWDNKVLTGQLDGHYAKSSFIVYHHKIDEKSGWVFTRSQSYYDYVLL